MSTQKTKKTEMTLEQRKLLVALALRRLDDLLFDGTVYEQLEDEKKDDFSAFIDCEFPIQDLKDGREVCEAFRGVSADYAADLVRSWLRDSALVHNDPLPLPGPPPAESDDQTRGPA